MDIQDRIGWYLAKDRNWYTRNVNTITKFSVHHDAIPHDNRSADQVMVSIFNIHNKSNGWPGFSYHYYIHKDGTIYQVNKHEWVTWIDGVNWDAIGIVLNGYFHPDTNNQPTKQQLASLKWLLNKLSTQHPEFPASHKDVYAHRERAQTACPGDTLYPYVKEYRDKEGQVSWGTSSTPVLPEPNPGYAPTHEGQTVEKDGKIYRSYKKDGQLLWTVEDKDDWEQKYKNEAQAHANTKETLNKRIIELEGKTQKYKVAIQNIKNSVSGVVDL